MRFFNLLGVRDVILFLFPTLIFILLFAVTLGGICLRGRDFEERKSRIRHTFPGGLGERDAPFPLVLLLIIAGFVLWAFFYTLTVGVAGVRI